MFSNNCSDLYNVGVFVPVPLLACVSTSCFIGIETKSGLPLLRNFLKNRGDV